MNKKVLLGIAIILIAYTRSFSNDTIYVYKTYGEYETNVGTFYDGYGGWTHVAGFITLTFLDDDKKVNFQCKEIWGFAFNGVLFRCDKKQSQFVRLVSNGKICYYENGPAHIGYVSERDNTGEFTWTTGYSCYVSKSLKTELVPLPQPGTITNAKKLTKEFRAKYPQYESLFKSIGKNWDYKWIRKKIIEFEEEKKPEKN